MRLQEPEVKPQRPLCSLLPEPRLLQINWWSTWQLPQGVGRLESPLPFIALGMTPAKCTHHQGHRAQQLTHTFGESGSADPWHCPSSEVAQGAWPAVAGREDQMPVLQV